MNTHEEKKAEERARRAQERGCACAERLEKPPPVAVGMKPAEAGVRRVRPGRG